jgi:hypothetical protein
MESRFFELETNAPDGAFSQYDIEIQVGELEKIPAGGTYLEVGVDKGRSLWVATQVRKDVRICGVDVRVDPMILGTEFTQGDSVEVSKTWADKSIDLIFIDGDHTYEGCKRDIIAWMPKLKDNGVMLFHDCDESSPGVVWAVAEYYYKSHLQSFDLFKKTDKNTSMARLCL